MKENKTQKGITLIALIITVIVLLILAGTAISISINGGNIFEKAQEAREGWNLAVRNEEIGIYGLNVTYASSSIISEEQPYGISVYCLPFTSNEIGSGGINGSIYNRASAIF